ncbi:PDGLE domain-containing protein [Patescibacteria group bacterium]|nr:PDGLE domain-containing protein [Patescibacteria group bacterium]
MKNNRTILILLLVAIIAGGLISFFASSSPDGLEKVAEEKGFITTASESHFNFIPDYELPLSNSFLAVSLAGIAGIFITFGTIYCLYRLAIR